MTRQEITGTRDLRFSRWMRINLPKSNTGWVSSDIDFYIYNYKTNIHGIIELKAYMSELSYPQQQMYPRLTKWISEGGEKEGWHFAGFFLIQFERGFFDEGRVYLNHEETSEEELTKILSLEIPLIREQK